MMMDEMTDPTAAARALYQAMGYVEWDRQPQATKDWWINGAPIVERALAAENEDLRRERDSAYTGGIAEMATQVEQSLARALGRDLRREPFPSLGGDTIASMIIELERRAEASEQRVKALEAALGERVTGVFLDKLRCAAAFIEQGCMPMPDYASDIREAIELLRTRAALSGE